MVAVQFSRVDIWSRIMPKGIVSDPARAEEVRQKRLEGLKKATKARAEKQGEAMGKRRETMKLKKELFEVLREELLKEIEVGSGKKEPYIKILSKRVLLEAVQNPNSASGQLVAKQFFVDGLVDILDTDLENERKQNIDFMRYRLHCLAFDKQQLVLQDRLARFKVMMTSRRAGKTVTDAFLLADASIKPNSLCVYIHQNTRNAIAQCYDETIKKIKELGINIVKETKNTTSDRGAHIELENGSIIEFRGNATKADTEKFQGFAYDLVIIDEAQSQRNLKMLIEEIITPTLTDRKGTLVLSGTPPRRKGTYFEFVHSLGTWRNYHWTMSDNPFIENAEEEIERICRLRGVTKDNPIIQREYMGKIVYDYEAMVFSGYKTYTGDIPSDFKAEHIYIGNDYGWSAYNAVIGIACNVTQRRAYVFAERRFNKATVTTIVEKNKEVMELGKELLRKSGRDLSNIQIFGDTSDNSILFEMSQTYGLPAFKCYKHNKDLAISQLVEECRTGRLLIPSEGVLADEFEKILYARDEEDNLLAELDESYHPDAMLALLYASRQMFFDYGYTDVGGVASDFND